MTFRHRPRDGFTLVELLVVLAIIAVLAGLLMPAVHRSRINQMVRDSESLVGKLQEGVDNQIKGINESVQKDRNNRTTDFQNLTAYCDGDPDRAAALLTYCRIRQSFPTTASELSMTMSAAPLAGQPGFTVGGVNFPWPKPFISAQLSSASGSYDQVSAAYLYVALEKRTQQGNSFASDVTSGSQMDIPLGSVTARVYKDPWGNPVGFARLVQTAELVAPPFVSASDYNAGRSTDRFDPLGKLAGTWTNKAAVENFFGGSGFFNRQNRDVVVYAAGKNSTFENLGGDDILGYRLRQLGAKGGKP